MYFCVYVGFIGEKKSLSTYLICISLVTNEVKLFLHVS